MRGNSTITQDDAIRWTKNWVNSRQEASTNKNSDGSYKKEFYADLFDSRTAKGFKVFSDVATKNRAIKNEYICKNKEQIKGVIFTTPFLVGKSFEALITGADGELVVNEYVKDAKIFLQVEDSLRAEVRVEEQREDSFKIVAYDSTTFVDEKIRLDCSLNPLKVNVAILY